MRNPVQVLVYLARPIGDEWEYLLLRRVQGRGGFWQGITGGVEYGEGLEAAAVREIMEETGLRPSKIESIHYSYSFPVEDKWGSIYGYTPSQKEIKEHVFVAIVDSGKEPKIDPEEHDQLKWCRIGEATELLTWSDNKEALRRADTFLKAQY